MASDRMRKKIKDYAEIFGHIMRKHALIMRKLHRIMQNNFLSLYLFYQKLRENPNC